MANKLDTLADGVCSAALGPSKCGVDRYWALLDGHPLLEKALTCGIRKPLRKTLNAGFFKGKGN